MSTCRFQQGDATNLSGLADRSFDLVVSIFGAMFAPKPFDVAREMVRVTRPGGRIVMNVMVANDIDPTPDRIAARLAGEELRTWIVDEQGIEDRNAVIACIPEKTLGSRTALDRVMRHSHEPWAIRRGRLQSRDLTGGLR